MGAVKSNIKGLQKSICLTKLHHKFIEVKSPILLSKRTKIFVAAHELEEFEWLGIKGLGRKKLEFTVPAPARSTGVGREVFNSKLNTDIAHR